MQWFDEVNRLCPGTPIVLVGLKSDLRDDPEAIEDMRRKSLRFVESQTVSIPLSLSCYTDAIVGRARSENDWCEKIY